MEGFGDKTIFLANLGVTTTQDGQLVLNNNRTFDEAFDNNPQDLTALFTDRLHSTSSLVVPKLSGAQTKTYKTGRYYFDLGTQGNLTGSSPSKKDISSNFTPSSEVKICN